MGRGKGCEDAEIGEKMTKTFSAKRQRHLVGRS